MRVVDKEGEQLGVKPIEEALQIAKERNLDLVQVTEKVDPPVCKITDYGKYQYQQEKREKKAKKQKGGELKGIRLTYNISQHDLETRAKTASKFLDKGNKVRIELPLKGRQKALGDFAQKKVNQFLEILKETTPIKEEKELKRGGRGLTMIISKE